MNSYSPLHLTACNREFWKRNLRKTRFLACVNPMIFLWFHLLPRNCSHDHFSRKNRRISQNEQSLGHAFPFACFWFPKNTGFAEPGLFRITGPSPDIWWTEVGEIIPRMSEYTGHYCVFPRHTLFRIWSRPSYCIHVWFSLSCLAFNSHLNFVFFMHA